MAHDFLLILWLGCTQKRDGIQLFARGVMLELSVFFDNSQIIVHLLRNIKFWIRPLENYRIIIIFNHLFNYMIIYIYILDRAHRGLRSWWNPNCILGRLQSRRILIAIPPRIHDRPHAREILTCRCWSRIGTVKIIYFKRHGSTFKILIGPNDIPSDRDMKVPRKSKY